MSQFANDVQKTLDADRPDSVRMSEAEAIDTQQAVEYLGGFPAKVWINRGA